VLGVRRRSITGEIIGERWESPPLSPFRLDLQYPPSLVVIVAWLLVLVKLD
jgi:hypothetical protein